MENEREYFQSAENAPGTITDGENNQTARNDIETIAEEETESLTLTIEDFKITENTMIGIGLGGSALIVSMCILGLISIFRRV